MNPYHIFSDSSCDMPQELVEAGDITIIPYYVSFDKEHYQKELSELTINDFYKKLTEKEVYPKTSLPSIEDFMNYFRPVLDKGEDVLCFCLTSKFSGAYQAALTAKDILAEEYDENRISIINTCLATSVIGLLLNEAVKMKNAGFSLADITNRVNQLKETGRIFFTVDTLEYLQKGGRIGKVSAIAGSLLNLKPLIVLEEGELIPYGKVRGTKKSYASIIDMTKEYFEKTGENYNDYVFCMTTGTNHHETKKVQKHLESLIERPLTMPMFQIGCTIGTYTGPNVIGICIMKRYDT